MKDQMVEEKLDIPSLPKSLNFSHVGKVFVGWSVDLLFEFRFDDVIGFLWFNLSSFFSFITSTFSVVWVSRAPLLDLYT
jgi:hypothetical protein